MKTAFAIAILAVSAFYFYNKQSSLPPAQVAQRTPALTQETQPRPIAVTAAHSARPVDAGSSAAGSTSTVVERIPKIGLNTGPNAQIDLNRPIDRKTGPNAQNVWNAVPNGPTALKTGPNAQTDLTMKRSW